MSTRRRYLSGALAVVLVLGVASSAALPASADRNSLNDKKRQQQQVRQQRALIASQIDTLKASDRQIDSALKAINANVQGTQAELESAQRALDQANHDAAVARAGHRGRDVVDHAAADHPRRPRGRQLRAPTRRHDAGGAQHDEHQ